MGGSAFTSQGLEAQRLEQAEYDALQARVVPLLRELYAHVQVPRSAPEKTSHGDLDVFAMADGDSPAAEVVAKRLGAVAFIESRPTCNYALPTDEDGKVHQVDVHECTSRGDWDVSMLMHEFGDLGMVLGKLAGGCGDDVVLRAYGLRMRTHLAGTPYLVLSRTPAEILEYLGLDPRPHERGFPTVQSMFEWLASSPYFDPSLFPLASPSGKERRQISRPGYVALVGFLAQRDQRPPKSGRTVDETAERFGVTDELRQLRADDARRRSVKAALTSAQLDRRLGLPWPNRRTVAQREQLILATQSLRTRLEAMDPLPSFDKVDELAAETVRTL